MKYLKGYFLDKQLRLLMEYLCQFVIWQVIATHMLPTLHTVMEVPDFNYCTSHFHGISLLLQKIHQLSMSHHLNPCLGWYKNPKPSAFSGIRTPKCMYNVHCCLFLYSMYSICCSPTHGHRTVYSIFSTPYRCSQFAAGTTTIDVEE